jgi:hypothetical protein
LSSATALNPLPINLVSFTGSKCNDGICLLWVTNSEQNCAYYDVEKSNDGINFSSFSTVPAKNTTLTNSYNAKDMQPFASNNFYRLKITDINGSYKYSDKIKIVFDKPPLITVFPNPAQDFVILKGISEYRYARIIDMAGASQKQQLITNGIVQLDITAMPAGVFFIELSGNNKSTRIKLLKQ